MAELGPQSVSRLEFEVSRSDNGTVVVTMSGELDMSSVEAVGAAVEPLLGEPPDRLVVDVAALTFADSSAIALWVRWANLVDQVEIRDASELLRRVIDRMGLSARLRTLP